MLMNLLRLAEMTGRPAFRDAAERTVAAFARRLAAAPVALPQMLAACEFHLGERRQIVLVGERDAADTRELARALHRRFVPNRIALLVDSPETRRALAGGYHEVLARGAGEDRERWFDSYLTTLIQRDLRDLADIDGIHLIPKLLTLVAARAGSTLNYADLALNLGISLMTVKRYLALLETLYLVVTLPPWFENLGKRLTKTPKLYLNDAGLQAHLMGLDATGLAAQPQLAGP